MRPFRFIASTHPRGQTKPSPDRDALSHLRTLIPSAPGYVGTFDYFAILGLTA